MIALGSKSGQKYGLMQICAQKKLETVRETKPLEIRSFSFLLFVWFKDPSLNSVIKGNLC